MSKTKRLKILEASLIKKKALFDDKLQQHFNTVKQSNGQPLNDKRNGQATLNKWDRQNAALRNLQEGIEKTERAIEKEKDKIIDVESAKETFPASILEMIESGQLIQWRRHPNYFFVKDVDRARIVWDPKKRIIAHKYSREVSDKEQWKTFASTFNTILKALQEELKTK